MTAYHLLKGHALDRLREMPDESVHCCVTSPPYWGLRDYGVDGQIGMEKTPAEYLANLVAVFAEVRRILRKDGTCWVNLGDSYCSTDKWGGGKSGNTGKHTVSDTGKVASWAVRSKKPAILGVKPKDLMGMPWRLAFALQDDGWWLRQDIIWAKPNCMPGSQEDRCTSSHEYVFMFTKAANYWSDFDAIKTPPRESSLIRTAQNLQLQAGSHRANGGGKTNGPMKAVGVRVDKQRGHSRAHAGFNDRWDAMDKDEQQSRPAMMRDVWFVPPASYDGAHFAVMPEEVARRCILAGCPEGGTVIDIFNGSGTTGLAALANRRHYLGIELNADYVAMSEERLAIAVAQQELFA
jgi:DNA modification methylase